MARIPVGAGTVYYCGTNLGEGAAASEKAFGAFIDSVCRKAGVARNFNDNQAGVHTAYLGDKLIAVHNLNAHEIALPLRGKSIFRDCTDKDGYFTIPANSADMIVID